MGTGSHNTRGSDRRFCVLEYLSVRDGSDNRAYGRCVILLVIEEQDELKFFVPSHLQTLVDKEDLKYIEQLLKDLPKRARTDAKALFDQLSSLSVGPLVTTSVGICNVLTSSLEQICAGLVPL